MFQWSSALRFELILNVKAIVSHHRDRFSRYL